MVRLRLCKRRVGRVLLVGGCGGVDDLGGAPDGGSVASERRAPAVLEGGAACVATEMCGGRTGLVCGRRSGAGLRQVAYLQVLKPGRGFWPTIGRRRAPSTRAQPHTRSSAPPTTAAQEGSAASSHLTQVFRQLHQPLACKITADGPLLVAGPPARLLVKGRPISGRSQAGKTPRAAQAISMYTNTTRMARPVLRLGEMRFGAGGWSTSAVFEMLELVGRCAVLANNMTSLFVGTCNCSV